MHAEAQSFADVVRNSYTLVIPFFQRGYVWADEHWEALLTDLLSNNEHYIGSVIFKAHPTCMGEMEWSVIDGQQRMTTLSVLFNVCYGILHEAYPANKSFYEHERTALLFVFRHSKPALKLQHSRVDRGAYETTICGTSDFPVYSDRIQKCANWFGKRLKGNVSEAERIFNLLSGNSKILVNIQLGANDNEQAIFDTINTAGVRLTAADTIKNLLFQRMIDLAGESGRSEIEQMHDDFWDATFNRDYQEYWYRIHSQGRINRSTLEMFLHNVAVIEGFYDPNKHSTSDLSECYKDFISKPALSELKEFVKKVAKYANCYRDFFWDEEDEHPYQYAFNDVHGMTLNVLRELDTSTFDPLILKLAYENPPSVDGAISENLRQSLERIVQYVLLHVVCGESTKNFNKECAMAISGDKPLDEYLREKVAVGKISNGMVRLGLRSVKNRVARCILFWMELKWRAQQNVYIEKLVFNSKKLTLEHMMPQHWESNWPVSRPQVVDPENGTPILGLEAEQTRAAAVYEIGNMTLLNNRLNSKISDDSIKDKIAGHDGKLLALADFSYTKAVIQQIQDNGYVWNEKTIRDRTNELTEEFLATWGAGEACRDDVIEDSHEANSPASQVETVSHAHVVDSASPLSELAIHGLDNVKISTIAKVIFPILFEENKLTDEDIAFLKSDDACAQFKTSHYHVLKETNGDVAVDTKDANGINRFYARIILHHGEKQYLLTSQWRADGKTALLEWAASHGINQDRIVALCMPNEAMAMVVDEFDVGMQALIDDLRAGKIKANMSEGRFVMEEDRYDKVAEGKVDREWVLLTRGQLKRSVGIKTVRLYKFDGTLKPKKYMRWEVASVGLEGEDCNGNFCEYDVVNIPNGFKPESIVIHLGKRIG